MNRIMLLASLTLGSMAVAESPAPASVEHAPVIKVGHKLACPQGARQVGGVGTNLGMVGCLLNVVEGNRVFHGPMISLFASGKVEAVGQAEQGFRTGKWTIFTEAGVKYAEIEFLRGDFHGRRAEFYPNGQLKVDEQWVMGKRQGLQRSFDASGTMTSVEYKDDRPVTATR
jgi:hypothetical protein